MLTYITSSPSPSRTSFCKAPAELLESEQLLVDINAGTAEELINEQRAAAGLPPIGTITTLESIGELGGEAAEDAAEKMVKEAVEAVKNYGKEVVEAIGKANSSAAASTAAASNAANDEKLAGVITSDKEAAEAAKKTEFSAASAAISSQNFSTPIENMEKMIDEAAEAAKKARKPAEDFARERRDKILTKMGGGRRGNGERGWRVKGGDEQDRRGGRSLRAQTDERYEHAKEAFAGNARIAAAETARATNLLKEKRKRSPRRRPLLRKVQKSAARHRGTDVGRSQPPRIAARARDDSCPRRHNFRGTWIPRGASGGVP
ncbi:hypothetical protein V498_00324 [Pseudogymnoascus sp. VKM F-4517 (FW-2822)]|nr:hypothetical protein V498_00324 [Pseudogymnoascus sp. VKM F-4517 (FW-2822)]